MADRVRPAVAAAVRAWRGLFRPSGARNARRLRERGESLDSVVLREAVAADIPALAALHVELWNATYRTARGPTVAIRTRQWTEVFAREQRRDLGNPTVSFFDRMGRERLTDDRGRFSGAFAWRDTRTISTGHGNGGGR